MKKLEFLEQPLRLATGVSYGLALIVALARYGATQDRVLYLVGLLLLPAAALALVGFPVRKNGRSFLVLAAVGTVLLAQVALQPTLEARGYLVACVGWIGLLVGHRFGSGSRSAWRLAWFVFVLGSLEAFYGLLQAMGGIDRIFGYSRELGPIATGTFINRNHFAGLLNMSIMLILGAIYSGVAGRRSRRATSESVARTWLLILPVSFVGLALLLSQSRGGALAFLGTLCFVAALLLADRRSRKGGRLPMFAVAGLLAVTILLIALVGVGPLLSRFVTQDSFARADVHKQTARMILDHPLLGVGPGMYGLKFRPYQAGHSSLRFKHAHNDYLEVAAEWGLPLAILFWAFVLLRLRGAAVSFLRFTSPRTKGVALGCAGAITSIAIHSLVDFNLHIPANLLVFSTILGMAWASEGWGEDPMASPGPTVSAARWIVIAMIVLAGWRLFGRYAALRAIEPVRDVASLEAAVELDPANAALQYALGSLYRDRPEMVDLDASREHLERAVALNPYDWRHHVGLARLYDVLGERDLAIASLAAAEARQPRRGIYSWHVANLYLRAGELEEAYSYFRSAVRADHSLRRPAVTILAKTGASPDVLEDLWPDEPEDRLELIRLLTDLEKRWGVNLYRGLSLDQWRSLLEDDSPPTLVDGEFFIRHLTQTVGLAAARAEWTALAGANGLVDPAFGRGANFVWNGAFELPFTAAALDWRMPNTGTVRVERAEGGGVLDSAAASVRFSGLDNFDSRVLEQNVLLEPSAAYRLSFMARGMKLTTDEGPFFEVQASGGGEILLESEKLLGSFPWRRLEHTFSTPTGTGQVQLRLRRKKSLRIDSKIRGELLIDAVEITGL